jgi:hypothetical protein
MSDPPKTEAPTTKTWRGGNWPFMRTQRNDDNEGICNELRVAVDDGSMGETVEKHQKLILKYYNDVLEQANMSFDAAQGAAKFGFGVLVVSLTYALVFDALNRLGLAAAPPQGSLTVLELGVISGALVEFIAGVAFVLYARGAKQFNAFHICLERTHRYLLAFKIAELMGQEQEKQKAFHELLCIMANAPMITPGDISTPRAAAAPRPQNST